jgi:competence protein ComEA
MAMKLTTAIKACVFGLSLATVPFTYAAPNQEPTSAPITQSVGQQVNINTADAATIAGSLKGIGMKKAEAIVAYRKENGPYKAVDDLMSVKGIGQKTLEQLRPQVSI